MQGYIRLKKATSKVDNIAIESMMMMGIDRFMVWCRG
jgi:hypothetical protein